VAGVREKVASTSGTDGVVCIPWGGEGGESGSGRGKDRGGKTRKVVVGGLRRANPDPGRKETTPDSKTRTIRV